MKKAQIGKRIEVVDPAPFGYSITEEIVINKNGHEAHIYRATKRTAPAPTLAEVYGDTEVERKPTGPVPSGLDDAIAAAIKAGVTNARLLVEDAPNKGVAVMRLRNAMKKLGAI